MPGSAGNRGRHRARGGRRVSSPRSLSLLRCSEMASQQQQQEAAASFQRVGHAFVHQYYHTLHHSPKLVHLFYKDVSKLGRPDDAGALSTITTTQAIKEKILSLEYSEYMFEIKTVDAQESHDNGVLVLVTGCLTGKDNVKRNFTQSFFLAPQDKGYFVLNDVFRYFDHQQQQQPENQVSTNGPEVPLSRKDEFSQPTDNQVPEQTMMPPEEGEEANGEASPITIGGCPAYVEEKYPSGSRDDVQDLPVGEPATDESQNDIQDEIITVSATNPVYIDVQNINLSEPPINASSAGANIVQDDLPSEVGGKISTGVGTPVVNEGVEDSAPVIENIEASGATQPTMSLAKEGSAIMEADPYIEISSPVVENVEARGTIAVVIPSEREDILIERADPSTSIEASLDLQESVSHHTEQVAQLRNDFPAHGITWPDDP